MAAGLYIRRKMQTMMPKCSNCCKKGRPYPNKPQSLVCLQTDEYIKAQDFCMDWEPLYKQSFIQEALIDDRSTSTLLDADMKEEYGDIKSARIIRVIHAIRTKYPYFLRQA